MVSRLKKLGYPTDKLALHYNENGGHMVWFWRSVFSEFLEAMVFGRVEPLQKEKDDKTASYQSITQPSSGSTRLTAS